MSAAQRLPTDYTMLCKGVVCLRGKNQGDSAGKESSRTSLCLARVHSEGEQWGTERSEGRPELIAQVRGPTVLGRLCRCTKSCRGQEHSSWL